MMMMCGVFTYVLQASVLLVLQKHYTAVCVCVYSHAGVAFGYYAV